MFYYIGTSSLNKDHLNDVSLLWTRMCFRRWVNRENHWSHTEHVNGFYSVWTTTYTFLNTLRPRQNGRHFADDSFKCIFLNENVSISIKISLRFDPKCPNDNIPALVQIMAWRQPGDKPLSEPMVGSLLSHLCVTRPQ